MIDVVFRGLVPNDAAAVSKLLLSAPNDYTKYFHPFSYDCDSIRAILSKAQSDQFFGLGLPKNHPSVLAGFYMLRGLDQGYADPMYGVFIGYEFRSSGLGQLTLAHAEAFCRQNGMTKLLLKVHPENIRAKKLYERAGFHMIATDSANDNLVMEKSLM